MRVENFDKDKHLPIIRSWWKKHWNGYEGPASYYLSRGRVLYEGNTPLVMVFLQIDDETKFAAADILTKNPFVEIEGLDKYLDFLFKHIIDEVFGRFGDEGVITTTIISPLKTQLALLAANGFEQHDPHEQMWRLTRGSFKG